MEKSPCHDSQIDRLIARSHESAIVSPSSFHRAAVLALVADLLVDEFRVLRGALDQPAQGPVVAAVGDLADHVDDVGQRRDVHRVGLAGGPLVDRVEVVGVLAARAKSSGVSFCICPQAGWSDRSFSSPDAMKSASSRVPG